MSNIVKARQLLKDAIKLYKHADELTQEALSLMRRAAPVRKARKRYVRITEERRSEIQRLALDKSLTTHEIATLTGLRSAGRVSEVLRGKR